MSTVADARNTALTHMSNNLIANIEDGKGDEFLERTYGNRWVALGGDRQARARAKFAAHALKTGHVSKITGDSFDAAIRELERCDLSKIGTKDLSKILTLKFTRENGRKQFLEKCNEFAAYLNELGKEMNPVEFKAFAKFAMNLFMSEMIAHEPEASAAAGAASSLWDKEVADVYADTISTPLSLFLEDYRKSHTLTATTIGNHLIGETYFNGGLAVVNTVLRNLLPSCSFSLGWMAPGVATATLTVAFIVATTPAVVKYAKVLANTNDHNLAYMKAHKLWATSEGRWFEGAFSGLWVSPVWMLMNALYSPLVSFHTILYPQIFLGLTLKSCFEKELAKLDEKMPTMKRLRTAAFNTVNHFDTAKALAAWLGAAALQGVFKDSFKFNFGASEAAKTEFNARPFASDQYDFAITMLSAFVFIFSYLKLAEHIKANWKAAPSAAPAVDEDKKDN